MLTLLNLIPKPLLLAALAALLAVSGWLKVENMNLTTTLALEKEHEAEF